MSHTSCGKLLMAIIVLSAKEPHDPSQELRGKFLWKGTSDSFSFSSKQQMLAQLTEE
jgi:hypothetical protein